jgi:site-specific DNA-methyltransferase (adenine-specific)
LTPWKEKREIGNATLYLGDCLEILPHLPKVDAVITDPPYNVGKDYGIHDDSMSEDAYMFWAAARVSWARAIAQNQFWVAPRYKMMLWLSLLPQAHLVVIRRGAAGPFRQGWSDQFETALAVGKPSKCVSDLWSNIRLKAEGYFFREETYGHPGYTPFPIMVRAVELFSKDSVCDPFLGTGTTGEAAVRAGRAFWGIEIEPKYFEIACSRIENAQRQSKLFNDEKLQTLRPEQISIGL